MPELLNHLRFRHPAECSEVRYRYKNPGVSVLNLQLPWLLPRCRQTTDTVIPGNLWRLELPGKLSYVSWKGYLKSTSSTSKIRVEFGGILLFPLLPYPRSGGIMRVRFSPLLMSARASSQPLITLPCPNLKLNGCPLSCELSNWLPFSSKPV